MNQYSRMANLLAHFLLSKLFQLLNLNYQIIYNKENGEKMKEFKFIVFLAIALIGINKLDARGGGHAGGGRGHGIGHAGHAGHGFGHKGYGHRYYHDGWGDAGLATGIAAGEIIGDNVFNEFDPYQNPYEVTRYKPGQGY
jgi:hypothetical protein